jgi:site-specific DNA recombinase
LNLLTLDNIFIIFKIKLMTNYIIYARKSTDEEDRQILSIDSQLRELRNLAEKENLNVIKEFIESKTAKEPGREIFNEMLYLIEKGEAEGIISWHPDRLARNSIDGGRIIYLVDTGAIKDLKFSTFTFQNNAYGKFMLSIAFGQSKYYVDNLSENVKRGMKEKVLRGEYPGWAPLGYLNDLGTHTIIIDEEKAPLVKKLFELYSTGDYSYNDLSKAATKIGLKGKHGKNLAKGNIPDILTNPFYYGVIKFKGELFEGAHVPLMSKQLFDKCQRVMKERSNPTRRKKYTFSFRGYMKCGECGASITAEKKKGRYVYYHCTKRKGKCSQGYIEQKELANQILFSLSKIWINDRTKSKIFDYYNELLEAEENKLEKRRIRIKEELEKIKIMMSKLLDSYLYGVITEEEYKEKKQEFVERKMELKQKLESFKRGKCGWLELSKDVINTCNSISKVYQENDNRELSKILQKTGSNFVLKNRQLTFSHRSPFDFISSFSGGSLNSSLYNNYFKKDSSVLGGAVGSFSDIFSDFSSISKNWLGCRDSNPGIFLKT